MKFLLPLLLISSSALALDFTVIGPCSENPQVQTQLTASSTNLGDFTVNALTSMGIPFTGDRSGISSIANSPRGDEALEILSDTQMRAYGWCVEVDGVQPAVMPEDVPLSAATKSVKWFYAYSLYDTGVWKDYCTPAWVKHSLPACH